MQRRRMTATALAAAVGVSNQMVSKFLGGKSVPQADVLRLIADVLAEPLAFFLRPLPMGFDEGSAPFMRSYASATKRARLAAATLKDRTREMADYVDRFVELPTPHFPHLTLGNDPAAIGWRDIERAAEETRAFWGLGDGPIANVVRLLEHHGGVVVRLGLGDETLDAFSQWATPSNRPFFILNNEKNSAVRSRFDALHELGHMVLHRHLPRETVATAATHALLEKQANHFAGAFLMPASGFRRTVFMPTLPALRELKPVWGASIAAMIVRLLQLDLITDRQYKRLWEAYAPWRRAEPLDDVIESETPSTLRDAVQIVRDECGISPTQLLADVAFAEEDVAAIVGLPLGFFREAPTRVVARVRKGADVLPFRLSRGDAS